MVKKAISHVHTSTPHKDRLVLVSLVAILAFQAVNTFILTATIAVDQAQLAMM